jgi:hypothetical protein
MTVSAAKLEANRRNAAKSCGPKTQAGKNRSKLNAAKHGMRAATLVLLDEDPEALEERRAEWAASLMPRGAAEQRIVDDAVEYSWLRDRARRAQEARLAANIVNAGVDEAIREADEVLRLGQKLFADQRGSLANYPHYDREDDEFPENVPVVSESEIVDGDPEDPQRLVGRLQTTAGGCQWMIDRWSELRSILEEGLDWQSADRLKAVRLLGRHPIEAVDDRNVLMIFVACQVIESRTSIPIPEIWYELRAFERKPYAQRLIGRGIEKLTPRDAASARQVLLNIVDRATAQIARKAETHRARAEINEALTADRLAFDDSAEGERLRRFDLACGRGLARSLDSLLKLRRVANTEGGPLTPAGDTLESTEAPIVTIEPTVTGANVTNGATVEPKNATNEATDNQQAEGRVLNGIRSRIKIGSTIENDDRPGAVDGEIVTNEATVKRENVTNEATDAGENSTNEATDAGENTTNEATDGSATVTNEPNDICGDVTNEATGNQEIGANEAAGDGETNETPRNDDLAELVNAGSVWSLANGAPANMGAAVSSCRLSRETMPRGREGFRRPCEDI